MKILTIVSAIDLSKPGGGIPVWWQMLKSFHEVGAEVIVVPCVGKSFPSPWWRSFPKPFVQNNLFDYAQQHGIGINKKISRNLFERGWKRHLDKIFLAEGNIEAILMLSVPALAEGIPHYIRTKHNLPTVYYESDIQNIPKYSLDHQPERHKLTNYFEADVVVCAFEKISQELKGIGVKNVRTVPFGADPTIFAPAAVKQDIDIFFSGYGALDREDWIRQMITNPSRLMKDTRFLVEGHFDVDLGVVQKTQSVSLDKYINLCRSSKINLNILRQQFVTGGVLNSRVFELASLECCVVSNPCSSLVEFFEPKKEIIVVRDENETVETYKWLLSSNEDRIKIGKAARQKVLQKHTYNHRARELITIFEGLA